MYKLLLKLKNLRILMLCYHQITYPLIHTIMELMKLFKNIKTTTNPPLLLIKLHLTVLLKLLILCLLVNLCLKHLKLRDILLNNHLLNKDIMNMKK